MLYIHIYIYIENEEENFKLNTLCLTSLCLQNNSVQMHHHSCTVCTYSNIFYWIKKSGPSLYNSQKENYLPSTEL